jgi:hypothetical protein
MKRFPFKKLEKLLWSLDCRYFVNCGGCGWIAYCVAINFERLNMPFRVVLWDDEPLNKLLSKNKSPMHAMLYCRRHYINSYEYDQSDGLRSNHVTMSSSNLLNYYNNCKWNKVYDREHNYKIKKIINDFFKQIKQ